MPPRKRKNDVSAAAASSSTANAAVLQKQAAKQAAHSSAAAMGSLLALALPFLLLFWGRGNQTAGAGPVADDLLPTKRLDAKWEVPEGLRNDLACNLHCVRNTTKRDVMIAELVLEKRKAAGEPQTMEWDLFVEDTCIEKCLLDHRKGTVSLGDKYKTVESLPAGLHEYFSCASGCRDDILALLHGAASAPFDAAAASAVLQRCGVMHVPLGAGHGAELVATIRAAYDGLGGWTGSGMEGLVDKVKPLRSGREEVWLPHSAPFTRFVEFLKPNVLGGVAWSFFNRSRIAVDHVNVVLAPGRGVTERQELHSDVGLPTEHLEVHIPLVNGTLPLAMGPTRFCPCTHGRTDLRDPIARSIRRYFASYQHCLEFDNLSWIFHSGALSGRAAEGVFATLYDADVYHQGLENVALDDRPVLVVALTTSQEAVHERNYVKRNLSKVHEDALIGFRSTDVHSIVQDLA